MDVFHVGRTARVSLLGHVRTCFQNKPMLMHIMLAIAFKTTTTTTTTTTTPTPTRLQYMLMLVIVFHTLQKCNCFIRRIWTSPRNELVSSHKGSVPATSHADSAPAAVVSGQCERLVQSGWVTQISLSRNLVPCDHCESIF